MTKGHLAGLATLAGPWGLFFVWLAIHLLLSRARSEEVWVFLPYLLCPLGLAAGYAMSGHGARGLMVGAAAIVLGGVAAGVGLLIGARAPTEDAGAVAIALAAMALLLTLVPFSLWAAWDAYRLAMSTGR